MSICCFLETTVTVISATSQISLNLNDMLVQSYSQVADLAMNERRYGQATSCYEKLLACLRARTSKTEEILKLMQKASQEIIAIRLQKVGAEIAREIRRVHAKHDPHKSIHSTMPNLFRRVVLTVSSESPGKYFDSLLARARIHEHVASQADEYDESRTPELVLEAERELACLVELSDTV